MKNAVLVLALVVSVVSASGLRVAGTDARLGGPILDSRFQILDCRVGDGDLEDTIVIAYDDGTHRTWWLSERDSFGAAVRFTPASYPCQVVGARAEVGYDDGQQVYLRVFDDNGAGGLPGTVLYEQQRLDIPHSPSPGFKDYDLTAPVVVDSGDFYICFWQKHYFHLLFGTDTHLDSVPREWWFFPDMGWVTPMGMDAADMLIRARVLYGSGVEEELTPHLAPRFTLSPNPGTGGFATIRFSGSSFIVHRSSLSVYDAAGRCVEVWKPLLRNGTADLDMRRLAAGVYLVRVDADGFTATEKLVVQP
jgi:hypothetical protein